MAQVLIEIDVLNSSEIIKEKKGRFLNWVASVFYSDEDLKKKVEEKICRELVKELRKNMDQGFQQEGISAKLKISAKF